MLRLLSSLRHYTAGGLVTTGLLAFGGAVFGQESPIPALPPTLSFKPPLQPTLSSTTPSPRGTATITVTEVTAPSGIPLSQPRTLPEVKEAEPAAAPAPTVESTPAPAASSEGTPCETCNSGFNFKKVPSVQKPPRPGFFPMPPTGPGYYTLWDAVNGIPRQAPPKYPYNRFALNPPSFFDADFRYLDDPKNTEHDPFDALKRIEVGDDWMFSTGGQYSTRQMWEGDSRLTRKDNTYNLMRGRVYGDLWYQDKFRVYAEFITAQSLDQDLIPLAIDRNKADFLNLFFDVKMGELEGEPVYIRVGRQELNFGSQRLISTLDWANTRRTFQGVRGFRRSDDLDVDLFWVQPVKIDESKLDWADTSQNFAGAFATYRPAKGQAVDFYYLMLDQSNDLVQQKIARTPATTHTIGSRYAGDKNNFLWDAEGAFQFGSRGGSQIAAYMAVIGAGYNFKEAPLNPTFWLYYDYASGDGHPNSGTYTDFNQLFPFGHYYFGWTDQIGRENIQDLNAHLYLYPANWLTVNAQYHHFWLARNEDALYNAGGNAIRRDATGKSGGNVGDEFDLIFNFHLSNHSDILTGYSYLLGGSYLKATSGPGAAVNSSLAYLMYSFKF